MFALISCFLISFFTCIASFFDEEDEVVKRRIIILTVILFVISQCLVFKSHDFKLSEPMEVSVYTDNIYSLNNGTDKVSRSFVLGSGSINSESRYSYFIQNSDGSKQKKHVSTVETKIYEGLSESETPRVEIITCESGVKYSFLSGWFNEDDSQKCNKYKETKIFVPQNTIILEYGVK